jgi:hypothetical protein
MKFLCFLLAALVQLSAVQGVQNKTLHPTIPTVTFDSIWEASTPQEYTITVRSDGPSTYLSRNPYGQVQQEDKRSDKRWEGTEKAAAPSQEKDPDFHIEFTISPGTAQRIFKDAEQANYFNGSFDFTKHAVANTGRKTLTYADPSRYFQTTFNLSENKAVADLARLFLGISNTVEFGRKLEFKHKYDKLGLESDLKAMEDAMEYHNLAELQLISPTLQSIAEDVSVLNIARTRAKHLLAKANGSK